EGVISSGGGLVAFDSSATDFAANDTNGSLDVFVHDRAQDQQPVTLTATDDNPGDLRLDLLYTCPDGTSYPVAVAVPPIDVQLTTASFETNVDPSFACTGGTVSAVVNDGFTRSAPSTPAAAVSSSKSPTAVIDAPTADQN